MTDSRTGLAEIAMALVAIAISAAFLVTGRNLGPGVFEPIGSGAVPNGIAWIAIALALVILVQAGRRRPSGEGAEQELWGRTALSSALLVAYVVALSLGLRYQWATLVYVPAAILAISPHPQRSLPLAVGLGLIAAFGLDYTFRHLLVTDLP